MDGDSDDIQGQVHAGSQPDPDPTGPHRNSPGSLLSLAMPGLTAEALEGLAMGLGALG